ncbi:MAG: calcium/sodium antiporter [Candidatus Hadarchaeales archaeon]
MEVILYSIALIASILIITKAGNIFVDSACAIAKGIGVSRAVIGLTIVSFATTAPEFFTSTMASFFGNVGMAYGNAVGSVVANTGLILAVALIMKAMPVEKERLLEGLALLGCAGLTTLMALDGDLNRYEAAILLVSMIAFLTLVTRREIKNKNKEKRSAGLKRPALLFIFGTLGIVFGSRLLVYSGAGIARLLGISEAVIGFTLLAVGTSIPELVTAVISTRKRVAELSLGNIIGANILDLLWVLGASGAISPLIVAPKTLLFSNLIMMATVAFLLLFMKTGLRLTRKNGVFLLAIYIIYLIGLGIIG